MKKNITGVLIDPTHARFGKAELDGTLDGYYKALNCTCFDVIPLTIGGETFVVYCDDEGLLKERPVPSALAPDGSVKLVGSLFIAKVNDEGDTESLNSTEIRLVLDQVHCGIFIEGNKLIQRPFLLIPERS